MTRRGGTTPDAEVATLRRYLKEIARYPPLTHDQEIELAERIQAGDEDAVREMVESNLRFVVAYAKRYRNPNVPFLDLIHEGNLGLIQAAKKYDPSQEGQDVKFITYAVFGFSPGPRARRCRSTSRWIRRAIRSWVIFSSRPGCRTPTICSFGRASHGRSAMRSRSCRRENARCSS